MQSLSVHIPLVWTSHFNFVACFIICLLKDWREVHKKTSRFLSVFILIPEAVFTEFEIKYSLTPLGKLQLNFGTKII